MQEKGMRHTKQEVQAYFQEVFEPELKGRGFLMKNGHYYRKNGNTFQAIGLDRSRIMTHLDLIIEPYWMDRLKPPFGELDLSVYDFKTKRRNWIVPGEDVKEYGDNVDYPEKMDLSRTIKRFREELLPMMDQIRDDESFCNLYPKITVLSCFSIQPAVLWLSYQKGSFRYWYDWYSNTSVDYYIALLTSLKRQLNEPFTEWPDDVKELVEKNFGPEGLSCLSPRPIEKIIADNLDFSEKVMNKSSKFVKGLIEKDDLEWIKREHDKESEIMREFFLRYFKLDYSE